MHFRMLLLLTYVGSVNLGSTRRCMFYGFMVLCCVELRHTSAAPETKLQENALVRCLTAKFPSVETDIITLSRFLLLDFNESCSRHSKLFASIPRVLTSGSASGPC